MLRAPVCHSSAAVRSGRASNGPRTIVSRIHPKREHRMRPGGARVQAVAGDGARCLALHAASFIMFEVHGSLGCLSATPFCRLHTAVWRGGRAFMSALSASSAVSHLMRSRPFTASMPLHCTEVHMHKLAQVQ